jgi:DHA2 family multidrug resistance protein-like MFS transporter
MASVSVHASMVDIAWRMALCGFGFGFFQAPNNRTMLAAAPLERSGAAGGMLATARLTGQTIGASLTAILFRMSADGPVLAIALAAVFAGLAALVSFSRLIEPRALREPPGRG